MTKLLINEPPLQVLPSLAREIGLNEAIILQQIHYWLNPKINKNFLEDCYWVHNSYEQWQEQFCFWSLDTIKRAILSLERKGLIISKNFNKSHFNKTKWYTIAYEKLNDSEICPDRSGQNAPSIKANCSVDQGKMLHSYIDTETTTEIIPPKSSQSISPPTESRKKEEGKGETNLMMTPMLTVWKNIVGKGEGSLTERPARASGLSKTLKNYFHNDLVEWEAYCRKLTTSQFLMGETSENFQINIDWALKPETIEKVLDGSIPLGTRVVFQAEDRFLKEANKIYDHLPSEEIDRYKEAYVVHQQIKDPSFSLAQLNDHMALYNGRFRHFVLTEIIKILQKEKV